MIKTVMLIAATCLLAVAGWFFWQQPLIRETEPVRHVALPVLEDQSADARLWRVVSRRVVTFVAANALMDRLQALSLTPVKLERDEEVTLHAFDDATIYATHSDADQAAADWRKKGFEVNVIHVNDSTWLLGLGRLYQEGYARDLEQKLQHSGRKYRYQKRSVSIPTWRFTLPAMDKAHAEQLWKQLEDIGVVMPVLMQEARFQQLYFQPDAADQPSSDSSATAGGQ